MMFLIVEGKNMRLGMTLIFGIIATISYLIFGNTKRKGISIFFISLYWIFSYVWWYIIVDLD